MILSFHVLGGHLDTFFFLVNLCLLCSFAHFKLCYFLLSNCQDAGVGARVEEWRERGGDEAPC